MRTRFPNLTVATVAVVALSGCEAMNAALFPQRTESVPASVERPAQTNGTPNSTSTSGVRPGVKPPSPPRKIDPKSLVGKNQSDVRDILGPPTTTQNAAPATIWRYTAQTCSFDVFFYMDLGTNTLRALTYDTKLTEAGTNDEATSRCLGAIQSTNRVTTR
jgi:hypothetical protein